MLAVPRLVGGWLVFGTPLLPRAVALLTGAFAEFANPFSSLLVPVVSTAWGGGGGVVALGVRPFRTAVLPRRAPSTAREGG